MNEREQKWTALMNAAIAGDGAAYDRLLRDVAIALRPAVGRALVRAGRGTSDTEDIVQETLIAIHTKRHTWDGVRPVGPWLRAIAHYKLLDSLRRRGARNQVSIDDFIDVLPAETVEPAMPDHEVKRHLDGLPDGQRTVVTAIAIEGASIGEAAERLNMTQGAVRVALHRALTALSRRSQEGGRS